MDTLVDLIRLLNVGLVLLFLYLSYALHPWWASRPKEERLILVAIPALLIVTAYASLESILQNLPAGFRIFMFTPVLILCIIGAFKLNSKIKKVSAIREEDSNVK